MGRGRIIYVWMIELNKKVEMFCTYISIHHYELL